MAKAGLFKKPNRSLERSLFVLLSIVLLLMLALGMFSVPQESKAMKYTKLTESTDPDGHSYGNDESRQPVEVLSWEPRAFLYHHFLTKDECEYLINTAKPHMERSYVVDSKTGKSVESRVRTSSGYFLSRGRDKIVRRIEKRIADFAHLPEENGEGLHVLHYNVGQKYEPHFDYFLDPFNTKNGGQRMATMLMYLSDVEKGGETVFPSHEVNSSSVPWWDQLSECGRSGLSVRPRMGDAILFWSMKPDATEDPMSLHGSCPVIEGNKWSATKWMHVDKYNM